MRGVVITLILNVTDLVTGIIVAVKHKEVESAKLRDGLFKKVGFIICYFVAWLIDNHAKDIGFALTTQILPVMLVYASTTEIVSIIENTAKLNPDLLPEKLMDIFKIGGNNNDKSAKH